MEAREKAIAKRLKRIEEINRGFPDADRYLHAECERNAVAVAYKERLDLRPQLLPPPWVKERFQVRILDWCREIEKDGVQLVFCEKEPYFAMEDMAKDIVDHKFMLVRQRGQCSVAGRLCHYWRAVHDYFGHFKCGFPFTFSGELGAWNQHVPMFPGYCHPFIWNNVVLENSFRLVTTAFKCQNVQCASWIVHDDEMFGDWAEFYRRF